MTVATDALPGPSRRFRRPAGQPPALRWPPALAAVVIGFLVAVFFLPSALTLPQTNPSETAEYAPVPPTDKTVPPPNSNMNSLGLGSSNSLSGGDANGAGGGGALPTPTPPPDQGGSGNGPGTDPGHGYTPSHLRCVKQNGQAKQTEDPSSPPCVSYYDGDNGGATYPGVTGTEIKVIVYMDGPDCGSFVGENQVARPDDIYFDFDKDPSSSTSDSTYPESMDIFAEGFRALDRYFNGHYQFYKRHIHMLLWHSRKNPNSSPSATVCPSAGDRQADAAEELQKFHPFAVINLASTYPEEYTKYMAGHGVVSFVSESRLSSGAAVGLHRSDFNQDPGLIWSYLPTMENTAHYYASFICKKIVGSPVSFSGNVTDQGKPRTFGFVYGKDPAAPAYEQFANLVRTEVNACGVNFLSEEAIPRPGLNIDETSARRNPPTYAEQAMADFKQKGITTVVWAAGSDDYTSKAAGNYAYYPEWILAGDRNIESNANSTAQNPQAWAHVMTESTVEKYPDSYSTQCYTAYQDADPAAYAPGDFHAYVACQLYPDLRLLATGLQVAGPHLTPQSIDQGYHAIPHVSLNTPDVPTCYFNPGDYACIKDAEFEYWNPTKNDPNQNSGCMQMVHGGKRYLEGNWPSGDAGKEEDTANDPCNAYA